MSRFQHRVEWIVADLCQAGGTPCAAAVRCGYGEQGLPVKFNQSIREQPFVAGVDRADVIAPRDVGRADHIDDAGRGAHRRKVEIPDTRMRVLADAHVGVQQVSRFRQVVHIVRRASHVLDRTVVRHRFMDGA